jgi:hypothetical protein
MFDYSVEAKVGRAGGDFKQATGLPVILKWNKQRYLRQINFAG